MGSNSKSLIKYNKLKDKLSKTKTELKTEKAAKHKLYKGLVKLASELKETRATCRALEGRVNEGERVWYEGGMWRAPELLHASSENHGGVDGSTASGPVGAGPGLSAVRLSDLFFDLVIVTAFNRVGVAIQNQEALSVPSMAYLVVFWLIWGKEASFATRFDTTDLSSQLETLLTCFAVLFGSLSTTGTFESGESTRIMIMAAFVAGLHFLLHARVFYWFRDVDARSEMYRVQEYAVYIMVMTGLEFLTWLFGILYLEQDSPFKALVFLVAILLSFRIPRTFLSNDFHAACSKRGVLFILLLGFIIQSIVLVASPFFDYQGLPRYVGLLYEMSNLVVFERSCSNLLVKSMEQYCFLGLSCFLLFCIKLLYVDDSSSLDPKDHALLVNRTAGFLFHIGQLSLLVSTTVLGAGLNLLTHSYMAATTALPANCKMLVCGGFTGVILSIGFIKSMHLRRVPLNPSHRQLFYAAYIIQVIVLMTVAYATTCMSINQMGYIGQLNFNQIEMLAILCCLALFLLVISWLDEAVELNLYGGSNAREFRVHPFGLWSCFKAGHLEPPLVAHTPSMGSSVRHLSELSHSSANLFDSQYGSFRRGSLDEEEGNKGGGGEEDAVANVDVEVDGERVPLVKFKDMVDVKEVSEFEEETNGDEKKDHIASI